MIDKIMDLHLLRIFSDIKKAIYELQHIPISKEVAAYSNDMLITLIAELKTIDKYHKKVYDKFFDKEGYEKE